MQRRGVTEFHNMVILAKRNENGKVITEEPNVKVKAPQEGKTKSSYFSQLGFTTIGISE
jgi:hypothetical protein